MLKILAPDVKRWLIWKDPDARKDYRWEEEGMTKDKMVGWHRQLNGHEFEWTPGVGDGQGDLACCRPWGGKESDTTEWLNWLTDNTEEDEFEWFYDDLQDLQERTPKKDVLFIIGDWNAKAGGQEIPTGKFGIGVQI